MSPEGPSLAYRQMAASDVASDVASGVFQLIVSRRAFFLPSLEFE